MFNPISSTVPPDCILMTRLAPKALSSTAPGTSASMVRARSMQTAVPVHMSLVSSYVPAASKILLIELSAIAAVNSPTVPADASFSGGEGGGGDGGGGEGSGGEGGGGEGGGGEGAGSTMTDPKPPLGPSKTTSWPTASWPVT
jgi:uncharacterized membrane protein YgcG